MEKISWIRFRKTIRENLIKNKEGTHLCVYIAHGRIRTQNMCFAKAHMKIENERENIVGIYNKNVRTDELKEDYLFLANERGWV